MHITLLAFGSRGDVQPSIALAKGLQTAGYTVLVAAGQNFAAWIQSYGLDYGSFSVDIEAIMNSAEGQAWVESGSNPIQELSRLREMYLKYGSQIAADLDLLIRDTDLIISGFVTYPAVDLLNQTHRKRHLIAQLQPVTPTRASAASMNPLVSGISPLNTFAGYVQQFIMWNIFRPMVQQLRRERDFLPDFARRFIRRWNATPMMYGFSPLVVPHPADWQAHIQTAGYWFLDEPEWSPPESLEKFLAGGSKPVYIGFGSMSNRDPEQTLRLIVDALERSGQRGVIASGWANLSGAALPDSLYMLSSAPHSWLFPRMAGVIHHGGAGTTAAGLRAGVPSGIIPHFSDQPYWGRRVHELGAGAKPVHRSRLTAEHLAAMIRTLVSDTKLTDTAARLGERIRAEDGVSRAVEIVENMVKQTH